MPTRVVISSQVLEYQKSLSPEPRRRVKAAIAGLANSEGDTKALHGDLEGLSRLRLGEHRIVYRYNVGRIEVFFAASRSIVYEFLSAHLHEILG